MKFIKIDTFQMSSTVAIDALPYYDHGYDEPGVREAAVKLVEEEMQRYRPTKDYLEEINLPAPGKIFSIMASNSSNQIFKNVF